MTLNTIAKREYHWLRAKDWPAKDALRAARIYGEFWELDGDLVKLEVEPEFEPWLCLDQEWGSEHDRKEAEERLNIEGAWVLVSYWRPDTGADWEVAYSIGGFIGDDWRDSGYDTDVRWNALECLRKHKEREAKILADRIDDALTSEVY